MWPPHKALSHGLSVCNTSHGGQLVLPYLRLGMILPRRFAKPSGACASAVAFFRMIPARIVLLLNVTAELWSLFSSGTGGDTPISHADIQAAKTWLRGMFVTVFDHNLSCLAVTCQRLAYEQACKLLDLSGPVSEPNIVWELANTKALQDAIVQMAVVPDLKDEFLMPKQFHEGA